jgi:hypothetical protein
MAAEQHVLDLVQLIDDLDDAGPGLQLLEIATRHRAIAKQNAKLQ